MVNCAIKVWGELINDLLREGSGTPLHFKERVNVAKEETLVEILVQTGYMKTEEELKILILTYQSSLNYVLNKLNLIYSNEALQSLHADDVGLLYDCIWAVVEFLLKTFPKFIDEEMELPLIYQDLTERLLDQIKGKLNQTQADVGLITVVVNTLTRWLERGRERVTLRKLAYMEALLDCFDGSYGRSTTPTNDLVESLIIRNFNALPFVNFVIDSILNELATEESSIGKVSHLQYYLRYISKLPTISSMGLYLQQSSVDYNLTKWLDQEIGYWTYNGGKQQKTEDPTKPIKITTSLSVPVLALISRIQKDAGLITVKSNAEYIRFVATHYTSSRKEDISYGHLHSAYYSVDEAAKRKAYDYFMTMAQMVKRLK